MLRFRSFKRRYKITIIGGYWEYHHVQLCFLNYLDKLMGKGFATYKLLLDVLTSPQDVIGSDLVIIARSRAPNILNIINTCKEKKISTLYMIDDNWFSIAKDFPDDYGHLFIAGNPEFETFLEAIKKCNAVITYNKNLHLDISKYNQNTILFPININLDFYSKHKNTNTQNNMIIGYAGSLRYNDTVFKALSKVAHENKHITVLLFGYFSQSQLTLFKDLDIIKLDYMPYPIYCNMIQQISPDILLAPLINNKTSISKCPNKYLEISAIKAAGIYSNTYPYNSVIKDRINGLLVPDNTVSAWAETITNLINNLELQTKIKENSYRDVKKHYSTDKLIHKFRKMINGIIE